MQRPSGVVTGVSFAARGTDGGEFRGAQYRTFREQGRGKVTANSFRAGSPDGAIHGAM